MSFPRILITSRLKNREEDQDPEAYFMRQMDQAEKGRTVSHFMTQNPVCADTQSSVRDVAQLFSTAGVRHLPVVDKGRLVGIVSDRDLRSIAGEYLSMTAEQTTKPYPLVTDFCQTDVITVSPEDDVLRVIDLMIGHNIGALPVVSNENQKLVGIVSYIDVLREIKDAIR